MDIKIHIEAHDVFKYANWDILNPVVDVVFTNNNPDAIAIGFDKIIDDSYIRNNHFENVQYILSPSTGIDHIRLHDFNPKVISLIPSKIPGIKASSEFALLLILSSIRQMSSLVDGYRHVGEDIYKKKVGLLGYGRIGQNLDRYLSSLGAYVKWHDINNSGGWSLEEVLHDSDIVILAITASEDNRGYLNFPKFNMMRKIRPYLINISRGFVIDDESLCKFLLLGGLRGFATDVLEPNSPIYKMDKNKFNIFITPHVAGSTLQARATSCDFVIKKMAEYYR
jgi:phosphoglycerate dehydrogenase-like enzyme